MNWIWVPIQALYIAHDRQIARHGGPAGIRDSTLLEMAHARPLNLAAYGTPDVHDLAAAYASHIAKADAFVDGNKRTAFVACATFLRLNGWHLRPDPADGVQMMEDLAASGVSQADFALWLRRQSNPL